MKKYLIVLLLSLISLKAEDINDLQITSYVYNSLSKNNTLFLNIGINNKVNNTLEIKTACNIKGSFLEYTSPKLNIEKFDKNKTIILYSKIDRYAIDFLQKLKKKGFNSLYYLKDGKKTFNHIIRKFRGIKTYSVFAN